MKNDFKLTVLIPTYNRAKKLKKTLSTFLINKNPKICFLLLNNNSTDNTLNVINHFSKNDQRIFVITHNKNIGAANNVRYGLKNAITPYVTIVSDDDYLVGDYFNSCLNIFTNNHDVGIVHHEFIRFKSKIKKNSFEIYKKGVPSAIEAYALSSVITGLSFRKKLLNFKKYPTDKKKLYSFLSQVLPITENYSFAKINNVGFIPLDYKNKKNLTHSISQNYILHERPVDYGISEICDYIFLSKYSYFNKLCILKKYNAWFCIIAKNIPKKNYNNFLDKTERSLGNHFFLFYLYLMFYRFNFKVFKYFVIKITNPKLLIGNIFNCLIFLYYLFLSIIRLIKSFFNSN